MVCDDKLSISYYAYIIDDMLLTIPSINKRKHKCLNFMKILSDEDK